MDQRLSLITLGVADLAAAKGFYEEGLRWKAHGSSQNSVTFYQLPGIALALWDRAALARDAQLEDSKPGFSGITLAYNTRSKTEVDTILILAEEAGAKILKPARDTEWGGYNGYFSDLDGHVWEVAYNPFWTVESDGSIKLGTAS